MISTELSDLVVIDDDADLRMLATLAFETEGWAVSTAPNGQEGLALLRDFVARRARPAVLLDVQMPDIDGWEVLGRIRADPSLRHLPVVLCTVRAAEEDRLRGAELGADGFIAKPFDVDDLVAQVTRVRNLSRPHPN